MLAIIKTGGKQYKVKEGDKLEVEKLVGAPGETVIFGEVLLVGDEKDVQVGTPFIQGMTVEAKIISTQKGDKVTGIKYKPKKREKVKFGHRQLKTKIKITKIGAGEKKAAVKAAKAPKAKKEEK